MAEEFNGKKALIENDKEFEEEEVWAATKGRETAGNEYSSPFSSASSRRIIPTIPRLIPRVQSGSFESLGKVHHQSSAPVNIPDFSKRQKEKSNCSGNDGINLDRNDSLGGDDDEEEDREEMLPPHEFIARRVPRSPIVSFSMCEGIGRTLKGRDLSRLRNAILTKTGFLE